MLSLLSSAVRQNGVELDAVTEYGAGATAYLDTVHLWHDPVGDGTARRDR